MRNLFLKILDMSFSAGWLILAVLLVRLVLKRAPKWVNPILWGIVALRLVMPFSIESALSLVPDTHAVRPVQTVLPGEPLIPAVAALPAEAAAALPAETGARAPSQVDYTRVAAWVWLGVVLALLVYMALRWYALRRRLRTAVRLEENVWQSEYAQSPFVLGLLRPRIYLPYSVEAGELPYILAHERMHIRRLDHIWKLLGYGLLAVYWFHPLVWAAYVLLGRDLEYACDEAVVRSYSRQQRAAYSQALLRCSIPGRHLAACPIAFGEVGVKERVKNVLNFKKSGICVMIAALAVCAAVAACFLTSPVSAEMPVVDEGAFAPEETTEAALSAEDQEAYDFYSAYLDAFRSGDKERWAEFLVFENEVVKELELDTFYPVDIRVNAFRQINDRLWLCDAEYDVLYGNGNTEIESLYNFVARGDDGLYVIRNVDAIPQELQENLDVSAYRDPDSLGPINAELMKITHELLEFSYPDKVEWADPQGLGADESWLTFEDYVGGTDTWEAEYDPEGVTLPEKDQVRTIRLHSKDGKLLLIREDTPWMACFDGSGRCIARYRCWATGAEAIGCLYGWVHKQL